MISHPPPTGLYVHIPFCIRRCLYCDFYVEPLGDGSISHRLREFRNLQHHAFLEALENELAALPDGFQPETLYVGGGTPTELPPVQFQQLLAGISRHIDCSHVQEWSCEANPGTMDPGMAEHMVEAGINRVSLGVQSFNNTTLELLGRIHDQQQARETVRDLRTAGVANLSIDLLFGLPRTPLEVTQQNLEAIADLRPEHVSWYSLEYEEGTALTDMRDKGFLEECDEEQTAEEYERIRQGLSRLGYQQYELFSFAKPGNECQHNRNYWQSGSFHGIGPSAFSHINGQRSANVRDLGQYIHHWKQNSPATEKMEELTRDAKTREALIIGLRQSHGIDRTAFEHRWQIDPDDLLPADTEWLTRTPTRILLKPEAYLISDALFRELAPAPPE